jgi:hypothetical protein
MSQERSRGTVIRLVILFSLLGLMVVALAYDYKVARPSVTAAEATVADLNREVNAFGGTKAMTNIDVQKALNRKPTRTFTVGSYQVEQYSWRSGLLFRSHNYYAVYRSIAGKLLFQMHFPYVLPPGVGDTPAVEKMGGEITEDDLPGMPRPFDAAGGGGMGGERRPEGEGDESRPESPEMGGEPGQLEPGEKEESPSEGKTSAKPAAEEPAEEEPAAEEPAEEESAEEESAQEKAAKQKPAEEKPAEEEAEAEEKPVAKKPAAKERPAEKAPGPEKPTGEKPAADERPAEKPA